MTAEINQSEFVTIAEAQAILGKREVLPVHLTKTTLRSHVARGNFPGSYNDRPTETHRGTLWIPRALLADWQPRTRGRRWYNFIKGEGEADQN